MNLRQRSESCRIFLMLMSILFTLILLNTMFLSGPNKKHIYGRVRLAIDDIPSATRSLDITIVIVVGEETNMNDYSFALNTVKCYSLIHNYPLRIVRDKEYKEKCPQKDFMFRRHCIVAEILETTDWVLFIDADVAVVNPKRLIEEYINPDFDLTFYERFYNWEVAMGSYIAKNTYWSLNFLRNFANYEAKLPASFHGTDNGAIHAYLLEVFAPESRDDAKVCYDIWKRSNGFDTLFIYEACIKAILGARREFDHLRIIKKGYGWVRDSWLAQSRWSPAHDFMLHGFKDKYRKEFPTNAFGWLRGVVASHSVWYPPLAKGLNLDECARGRGGWVYDANLKISKRELEEKLAILANKIEREKWTAMSKIPEYL